MVAVSKIRPAACSLLQRETKMCLAMDVAFTNSRAEGNAGHHSTIRALTCLGAPARDDLLLKVFPPHTFLCETSEISEWVLSFAIPRGCMLVPGLLTRIVCTSVSLSIDQSWQEKGERSHQMKHPITFNMFYRTDDRVPCSIGALILHAACPKTHH